MFKAFENRSGYHNWHNFYLIKEPCVCAGIANKYNEGESCAIYRGYHDEWRNGMWCNVNTSFCTDAREHPSNSLPGYGASRAACNPGMKFIADITQIFHYNFENYTPEYILTFISKYLYLVKTGLDCSPPFLSDGVTVSRATVVSPTIGGNTYIYGLTCGLTINVAAGKLVSINFEKFKVGDYRRDCENDLNDYLEIRDGRTDHSNLIGPKLCGLSTPRAILSTNNSVTLGFFTKLDKTFEGFRLTAISVGK